MPENRIAALPAPEVAARVASGHAVILPLGSTETHGPALPMGDYVLAEAVACRIAVEAGDALVAPSLPFGGADFFRGVPGGAALFPATLAAVVTEVLEALREGGATRLLVLNGHGGNIGAIEAAQRRLRAAGMLVPAFHIWRNAAAWHAEDGGSAAALGHGGDPVASVALHLFPGLCVPSRLGPGAAPGAAFGLPATGFGTVRAGGAEFALPLEIGEIAPGGVQAADARGASAELGARLVARMARAGAAMLEAMRE